MPGFCCTGCEIRKSYTLKEMKEIRSVLHGIGYSPMAVSHAAANRSTLSSTVYRLKGRDSTSFRAVINFLENFDQIIKNKVDEADRGNSVDDGRDAEVMKLSSPYCRFGFIKYYRKLLDLILLIIIFL